MKKYLSEIHTKSPGHKKRFALLVSGCFTLLVFTIWSAVMFGRNVEVATEETGPVNLAAVEKSGFAPFQAIISGIKSSWNSLTDLNGE